MNMNRTFPPPSNAGRSKPQGLPPGAIWKERKDEPKGTLTQNPVDHPDGGSDCPDESLEE